MISALLCAALLAGSFGVPVHAGEAETAETVQTTDSLEDSETGETVVLEETVYETETDTQAERQETASKETVYETETDTQAEDEEPVPEEVIDFKDENLKKALAEWDADGDGDITQAELAKAKILDLGYCGISDISGLEYAINATDIILSGNSDLEDISPLYLLTNLRALIVGGCNITDITGIEYLTGLMPPDVILRVLRESKNYQIYCSFI